jgi:hypothetical protein
MIVILKSSLKVSFQLNKVSTRNEPSDTTYEAAETEFSEGPGVEIDVDVAPRRWRFTRPQFSPLISPPMIRVGIFVLMTSEFDAFDDFRQLILPSMVAIFSRRR